MVCTKNILWRYFSSYLYICCQMTKLHLILNFWAAEYRPALCQQATFIQCVNYGNTYIDKSFAGTGGGDIV